MTNAIYTRLQATANRLLQKYGQVGSVSRTPGAGSSIEGEGDTPPVPDRYPAKLFPATYDQKFIDGTNIKASDRQIYISSVGLSIEPAPGDVVSTTDGKAYLIIAGDPNNYDGMTNVVFKVQGRIANA